VGLSLYILLFLPVEYLLTEVMMKISKIPSWIGVTFLILLIFFLNFVKWNKILISKKKYIMVFVFILFNGLVYAEYRNSKKEREYLPKIYKVFPSWGIQGQISTINGVNLGKPWSPGKIIFEGKEMIPKKWSENEIIFELPVLGEYDISKIYLQRSDGVISNGLEYEVKNPNSLK
jgi:hypothetical protein